MTGVPDSTDRLNFIEQVIVQDNREGDLWGTGPHSVSAGTQRLFAHRTCEEHLPEFWLGEKVQGTLQPALRRHESHQRK